MDDANNHTAIFTAADIERYHKGLLSSKEMHDLEKAALDDPFLADALEGYNMPGVNVAADMAELKKQLAQKTEEETAKVIPMAGNARSFPWLRAAVLIVGIAGAALLTYQLAFNNKKDNALARNESPGTIEKNIDKNNAPATTTVDSNKKEDVDGLVNSNADTAAVRNDLANGTKQLQTEHYAIGETNQPTSFARKDPAFERKADSPYAYFKVERDDVATTSSAPSKALRDGRSGVTDSMMPGSIMPGINRNANPVTSADDKVIAGAETKGLSTIDVKPTAKKKASDNVMADRGVTYNSMERARMGNSNNGFINQQGKDNNYYKLNSFRGQVLDNNNNPLPFANVTNVQDGIGTYADSKGYFNLTSTADSQLNVNVRVLGYNNLNYQLKSSVGLLNKVQLQEDRSLSAQVVEKNKKANEAARKSRNTMKLAGEPEPEDGWDNYYSYLDNNTNAPDEAALRAKENATGLTVDISFEVNKYGEPVDIKIERSLCPQCNDEAIRLIKQGPKWKRKAKKGRTTVTISF